MNAPDPLASSKIATAVAAVGPTVGAALGVVAGDLISLATGATSFTEKAIILVTAAVFTAVGHWLSKL